MKVRVVTVRARTQFKGIAMGTDREARLSGCSSLSTDDSQIFHLYSQKRKFIKARHCNGK